MTTEPKPVTVEELKKLATRVSPSVPFVHLKFKERCRCASALLDAARQIEAKDKALRMVLERLPIGGEPACDLSLSPGDWEVLLAATDAHAARGE